MSDLKYKDLFHALVESYSALRNQYIQLHSGDERHVYCPLITDGEVGGFDVVGSAQAERDIFVLSIINWDYRYQRPQHISSELSKKSRVFYIEMELSPVGVSITKKKDNVYVVRLPMGGVGVVDLYDGFATTKQAATWIENFYKFVDQVNCTAQKCVILQHPWWWQFASHLPPEFQITFDCMDDISGFSNTTKEILDLEQDLIKSCDHLVVSSQALYDSTKEIRNPILVRNGCALEHFQNFDSNVGERISIVQSDSKSALNIGYVGALAEWFDTDLLLDVVRASPELCIHICGDVTCKSIMELDKYPNVNFYGEVPYAVVPGFIDQMDVMIIPFKLTPIIKACDPVKFYEHCIMGVPTVSTCMPELVRAGDNVALASTAKEFTSEIYRLSKLRSDKDHVNRLKKYAKENCWERRAGHLWGKISNYPLVSVVILNYGNPNWCLGAIHSLTNEGGNYPNLQIIVVDNGSSVELLDKLESGISKHRNKADIELVRNTENLGFAKGNNVGIEICKGEYVVLLNNDTYVSPGAINSLVRQLQQNPDIGAVGPLTNNIGNEAKLFVNYPDISAMAVQAKRWLTGYRNQNTTLRNIAYFCVAFRMSDLEEFGGLSEDYGTGMFEDDDHCNVIRQAGFRIALAEDAFVHHHLSATFGEMDNSVKESLFERNKRIYESRWGEWVPHVYREKRPLSQLEEEE